MITYSDQIAQSSIFILINLMKLSDFFKECSWKDNYEDFIKNEDALFFGVVLNKLHRINQVNSQMIPGEYPKNCRFKKDPEAGCTNERCCTRGNGILRIASMMNHSCDPNVINVSTAKEYFILYSLGPIKKGEQVNDE